MEILVTDKNRYGDEVLLKKDTTKDIDPVYLIEVDGKTVFETKNFEKADAKFFNIVTAGY